MEDARTLRGAQPLVPVARPVRRPQSRKIDRDHARCVRPVDERVDVPAVQLADQRGHRQHEGRRRRHLADERQARARRHRLEKRFQDPRRIAARERHPDDDDGRAIPLRRRPEGVERRVVLVVAGEELVAGAEPPRRQDRGDAGGGVGDERQAVRVRAQEGGDIAAGVVEMTLQLAVEEAHRLALQAVTPGALGLEDRFRTRPERPVVEEGDVRFQEPWRAIEGACGHAATLAHGARRRVAATRIRRGSDADQGSASTSPARSRSRR